MEKFVIPGHTVLGLERVGCIVHAAMYDPAIVTGLMRGDGRFFFDDQHFFIWVVSNILIRRSQTD